MIRRAAKSLGQGGTRIGDVMVVKYEGRIIAGSELQVLERRR